MPEEPPDQIGRYKVQGELGRGGFGRVYRAYDPTVGRPVAIKILSDVSAGTLTRFRNEAVVAGNLRHKNIVTVYEYGAYEGLPFLAMEYLEGEDLHQIISSHRSLSLLEKCNIMSQVADGLCYAHSSGVVHRDMKPANIMVLRDGAVKIMDFGIARITRTPDATRLTQQGFLIGTLRYMAPEQLAGAEFDAQCDIFAYGLIFYELVTGRHPFEAADAQRLMYRLTFDEPAPIRGSAPDTPDALEQAILKMVQKDRDRRYRNMKELQFDAEPVRIDLQRARASELLLQAQQLFEQEQLEPAQKLLHEALVLEPSNRTARGLWERLQQQLKQRTLHPRIEAALSSGEIHLGERRFADAVRAFESALLLDRENASIQGRLDEARALMEHAGRTSELLAEARKELEQQNLTAAYRIVSEALRHDPTNPEATEFLKTIQSYVERRQAEQRVDDAIRKAQGLVLGFAYDEALAALMAADPESPPIRECLERVRSEKLAHERKQKLNRQMAAATDLLRGHRLDEAAKCLKELQAEHPDNQDVAHLLAYAEKELAALARTKAIENAAAEAHAHAEAKDYEAAVAALDRALKQYPGDSALARLLGSMMTAKTVWEQQRAVQATLARCESLRSQDRLLEALRVAESALKGNSAEPALMGLHKQLETELAEQRRNQAVHKIVDHVEQLLASKQSEAALEAVQRGRTRYPTDAVLEKLLKRVQEDVLARKNAQAAERAAAIDQRGQEARLQAAAGDFDRALALLNDGLRNWPDAGALQEIRKSIMVEQERHAKRRRAIQKLEEVKVLASQEATSSDTAELLSQAVRVAAEYPHDEQIQSIAAEPISLLSDIGRARQQLAAANFQAVLDICGRQLSHYPGHRAFAEFKREAERGHRRGCLLELQRRAAAERDLKKRAWIFEKGLEQHPDDSTLADELKFTRNKIALVDSIVEEARGAEKTGRWELALEKWNSLLTVYNQYPGLHAEIERVGRAGKKALSEAVERHAKQIEQILQSGDSKKAAELLRLAQIEHPGATRWTELARRVERSADKRAAPAGVTQAQATAPRPRRRVVLAACGVVALLSGAAVAIVAFHSRGPGETTFSVIANIPGTTVSVGGKNCMTPNCAIKLPPGTYTLVGAAEGYQTVTQQVTIAPGQAAAKLDLSLSPIPELLQVNTNFESGQVYLDGRLEGDLRDGQYTASGIKPGRHTLRVTGSGEDFQSEWNSAAGQIPELLGLTSGKDLQATVVANAGTNAAIHCNCETRQVAVDGVPAVGSAASVAGGVAVKGLKLGARQLVLGERSLVVNIRPNPALTAFLNLNRNVGMLIVETGEDGVKIYLNNRPYRRTTEHGSIRIPVNAGEYVVRVEKDGFFAPPSQKLALRKGEEKPMAFLLTRAWSRLEIAGAISGAQVRVDGQSIGETDRNGALQREVAPGTHTIELSKDDYAPVRLSEQFRPGKSLRLDRGRVAMAKSAKTTAPEPGQTENKEWAQLANSTNPDDFDSFIRNHPGGTYIEQARTRAAELRQQLRASAAQQVDQTAWERLDPKSRDQLQEYLSRFPAGLHAQEARARIADTDRQAAEALAAQRVREQKDQEQAKRAVEEQAIVKVLRDFDTAFNQKDLSALQKLWSGLPVDTYRKQFRDAKDLKFQLQLIGSPEVTGNSAKALCTRTLSFRGQNGGLQTRTEHVKLTLSRDNSGWLIQSITLN